MARKTPAILVQRERPLDMHEIRDELVRMPERQFQALEQVIDEMLLGAVNDVADQRQLESHARMAATSGWIDCLASLKSRLADLRSSK
jgi:hypothetical protein